MREMVASHMVEASRVRRFCELVIAHDDISTGGSTGKQRLMKGR